MPACLSSDRTCLRVAHQAQWRPSARSTAASSNSRGWAQASPSLRADESIEMVDNVLYEMTDEIRIELSYELSYE